MSGTASYWEWRYKQPARHSGSGSRGELAEHKANVVNEFVERHSIESIVEWGCGDGYVASKLIVPEYVGIDVAPSAIARCKKLMPTREFRLSPLYGQLNPSAELSLSMDTIYHLIFDSDYREYMRNLFDSATRFVGIYSPDRDSEVMGHVRYRQFTLDVPSDWELIEQYPAMEPSTSEWFFYARE